MSNYCKYTVPYKCQHQRSKKLLVKITCIRPGEFTVPMATATAKLVGKRRRARETPRFQQMGQPKRLENRHQSLTLSRERKMCIKQTSSHNPRPRDKHLFCHWQHVSTQRREPARNCAVSHCSCCSEFDCFLVFDETIRVVYKELRRSPRCVTHKTLEHRKKKNCLFVYNYNFQCPLR